jgi:D-glycero-D-manno-heptose 1,7-bisphosphate phosphatase
MKPAVFFERDGVLNLCETRGGQQLQPLRVDQFRVNENARGLLIELKRQGFVIIATTNQPALSRGLMSRSDLDLMHLLLRKRLPLDDICVCTSDDPHHPCYKPQPGLFLEAAFKWSLDLDRSFIVSDKWPDAKAAQVAGCTSVMIRSPWIGKDHHDFVVDDLDSAVGKILQLNNQLHTSTYAAGA